MNKLWIALVCWSIGHDYTCKANEGIKPSKSEIDAGLDGFFHYAIMYCKRCGHVCKPDRELRRIVTDLGDILTKLRKEVNPTGESK